MPHSRAVQPTEYGYTIFTAHPVRGKELPCRVYISYRRLRPLADRARLRQYETTLKEWKLGKYIKHREMAAIVRKMQHRRLVEVDKGDLSFEVRNKPVEMDRIRRWMRTHGVASDDIYVQSPPVCKYTK